MFNLCLRQTKGEKKRAVVLLDKPCVVDQSTLAAVTCLAYAILFKPRVFFFSLQGKVFGRAVGQTCCVMSDPPGADGKCQIRVLCLCL